MKRIRIILLTTVAAVLLSGCSITQAIRLKDCEYKYAYVSDVTFMNMNKRELMTMSGVSRATQALLGLTEKVTLGFTVHMDVQNPNNGTASMDRLFYSVMLDSIEIAEGNNIEPFIVAGHSSAELPLKLHIDLKTLLQRETGPTLVNVVKNFIGLSDTPTVVTVNLRPIIRVAGTSMGVPRSIPLTFEYGGKKDRE